MFPQTFLTQSHLPPPICCLEEEYVKYIPHPLNNPEELEDPTCVSAMSQQTHSSDGEALELLED